MKYLLYNIYLGVFVCLFGISFMFAQTISLQVSESEIDINESFRVTITVDTESGQPGGQVSLDGIDQFDFIGQASSQNIQIVNNQRNQQTQLQLELKPKEIGEFILGPARLPTSSGLILSNELSVTIGGEKLFVNGAPQGWEPIENAGIPDSDNGRIESDNNGSVIHWIRRAVLVSGIARIIQLIHKAKRMKIGRTDSTSDLSSYEEYKIEGFEKSVEPTFPKKGSETFLQDGYNWLIWHIGALLDMDLSGAGPQRLKQEISLSDLHSEDKEELKELLSLLEKGLFAQDDVDEDILYEKFIKLKQ